MKTCDFPSCPHPPRGNAATCVLHAKVTVASAWSSAGEDEGHRRGSED